MQLTRGKLKATTRSKKMWVILGLACVLLIASLSIFAVFYRHPLLIQLTEKIPFVDAGGLTTNCSLVPNDSKKKAIVAGDAIKLTCSINNTSKQELRDLTLQANVDNSKINYIRELKGATGIADKSPSVVFLNIIVPSKGKTELSLIADTNYSNTDYKLAVLPELKQRDRVLVKGEQTIISVSKNKGPTQIRVQKIENKEGER